MSVHDKVASLERLASDASAAPGERDNARRAAQRLREQHPEAFARAPEPAPPGARAYDLVDCPHCSAYPATMWRDGGFSCSNCGRNDPPRGHDDVDCPACGARAVTFSGETLCESCGYFSARVRQVARVRRQQVATCPTCGHSPAVVVGGNVLCPVCRPAGLTGACPLCGYVLMHAASCPNASGGFDDQSGGNVEDWIRSVNDDEG